MNNKGLFVTQGLALVFALFTILGNWRTAYSQECTVIRIQQELGSAGKLISIQPETLNITKGTCVVWINWIPAQEVRINFREDGKKCQDATEAPMGFKMTENCYLTNFIPLGGTSSLRFNQEGTFKYEVEVPGEKKATGPLGVAFGDVKGSGVIVVK